MWQDEPEPYLGTVERKHRQRDVLSAGTGTRSNLLIEKKSVAVNKVHIKQYSGGHYIVKL